CIHPEYDTVLNPAAWVDAPLGTFGAQQTYYGDFRGQRRPSESMSFGKRFAFGEKTRKSLTIRAEFFNVFNRLVSLPDPVTSNPRVAPASPAAVPCARFARRSDKTRESIRDALPDSCN